MRLAAVMRGGAGTAGISSGGLARGWLKACSIEAWLDWLGQTVGKPGAGTPAMGHLHCKENPSSTGQTLGELGAGTPAMGHLHCKENPSETGQTWGS